MMTLTHRITRYFAASIAVCVFAGAAQGATLTAYYDFEDDGDRFNDIAGLTDDRLDGQYNAAFSSDTPGAFAGASSASFDGDSALFTDAYSTDLGPDPDAFTIMFWVKARDIDQENNNTRLMSTRKKPDGSNTDNTHWQIEGFGDPDNGDANPTNDGQNGDKMDLRMQDTTGTAFLFTQDATNALARADQGETVALWRHVAFVVANSGNPNDGGAFTATYVDGTLIGSIGNPNTLFDGTEIGNDLGQLILGGDAENAGSRAFVGLLDDVALWAGVVDAADIADIAAGTASPTDFIVSIPTPAALPAGLLLIGLAASRRRRA